MRPSGDPCSGQQKWMNAEVVCSLPVNLTVSLPVDCTLAGGVVGKPGKDCWGYPDGFASPDNGGLLSETQNVTVNADGSRTVHDLRHQAHEVHDEVRARRRRQSQPPRLHRQRRAVQRCTRPRSRVEDRWLLRRRAPSGQGHVPAERQCVSHVPDEQRGHHDAARAVRPTERSRRQATAAISVPRGAFYGDLLATCSDGGAANRAPTSARARPGYIAPAWVPPTNGNFERAHVHELRSRRLPYTFTGGCTLPRGLRSRAEPHSDGTMLGLQGRLHRRARSSRVRRDTNSCTLLVHDLDEHDTVTSST